MADSSSIRIITHPEPALLDSLCSLLQDGVAGGASIGFLGPLSAADALQYWRSVFAALGPELALWVAQDQGQVVGSVQLAPSAKQNARHRAEVQKLLVRSSHRARGLAGRLMAVLEAFARSSGRSLLLLDTQTGSHADMVYRHLGWQRVGEAPGHAADPGGKLQATTIFFKQLSK